MKTIERSKNFMNTVITFKVVQNSEKTVDILNAIEDGFGEFDRIVKQYTRFNEDSELSNLNRNAGSWVKVSEEFFSLIEYMLDLSHKSDGNFDPTIIDFLEIYGYDKNYDFSKLNNPKLDKLVQDRLENRPKFSEIELNKEDLSVKLAPDQRIDLGGIGKGYAIDCAYNVFKNSYKIENFLIDAGGDIRAAGKNENNTFWKIDLKDKNENGEIILGELELNNRALACSGSWARKVKQFHHLINPRTGAPENSRRTVYVEAENALLADSWATTIFVGGENVLKNAPQDLKYYFL